MKALRPQPMLGAIAQAAGRLAVSAWGLFVWDNVRAGTIDLAGTSRSFRLLMRVGLWATLGLLGALLFADAWRLVSPLQPLTFFTDALAGSYAPTWLTPVAFGLLTLAWAYLLCGALHAHWLGRLALLALFAMADFSLIFTTVVNVIFEIDLLISGLAFSLWGLLFTIIHLAGWAALIGVVILRWRRPPQPGLEFPLVLSATAALFFSAYFGAQLGASTLGGTSASVGLQLTQTLDSLRYFLTPFLVISGVEVVQLGINVTRGVTTWLERSVRGQRAWGARLWTLALGAFLAWRMTMQWAAPMVSGDPLPLSWGAVLAALAWAGLAGIVSGARWLRPGRAPLSAPYLPGWMIPGLAVALYLIVIVINLVIIPVQVFATILVFLGAAPSGDALVALAFRVINAVAQYNEVLVGLAALLTGFALWTRARTKRQPLPAPALFAFVFAGWLIWWQTTRVTGLLGALTFRYEHFSAAVTVVLAGVFLLAIGARRLGPYIRLALTAAALLFWVLEAREFLDNPLSPLSAVMGAGVVFLAVGVFLNIRGAGERFGLNDDSPAWPRATRGLLYFGYALLTLINLYWLAAGHQGDSLAQQDLLAFNGFIAIGLPLALWALIVGSPDLLGLTPDPANADQASADPV